jgi:hypothetical protein
MLWVPSANKFRQGAASIWVQTSPCPLRIREPYVIRPRSLKDALVLAPLGGAYFVAGKLGLKLAFVHDPLISTCSLGSRGLAKSCYQHFQMWAISLRHGREFEPQSAGGFCMAHNSVGPDLSLLYKKINLGYRSHRPWLGCLDEQTSDTEIPNVRNIVSSIAAPINPHVLRCVYARGQPPGTARAS